MEDLGQIAYEAYSASPGGKFVSGEDWAHLDPQIREAWRAAAEAVASRFRDS